MFQDLFNRAIHHVIPLSVEQGQHVDIDVHDVVLAVHDDDAQLHRIEDVRDLVLVEGGDACLGFQLHVARLDFRHLFLEQAQGLLEVLDDLVDPGGLACGNAARRRIQEARLHAQTEVVEPSQGQGDRVVDDQGNGEDEESDDAKELDALRGEERRRREIESQPDGSAPLAVLVDRLGEFVDPKTGPPCPEVLRRQAGCVQGLRSDLLGDSGHQVAGPERGEQASGLVVYQAIHQTVRGDVFTDRPEDVIPLLAREIADRMERDQADQVIPLVEKLLFLLPLLLLDQHAPEQGNPGQKEGEQGKIDPSGFHWARP